MLRRIEYRVAECVVFLAVLWPDVTLGVDWIAVGGDRGNMRYSELTEITRENVGELEVAW